MDSHTICEKHYRWHIELEMPEDAVVKSLNRRLWNDSFERNIYLSEIQSTIGVDLSDIEKLN